MSKHEPATLEEIVSNQYYQRADVLSHGALGIQEQDVQEIVKLAVAWAIKRRNEAAGPYGS